MQGQHTPTQTAVHRKLASLEYLRSEHLEGFYLLRVPYVDGALDWNQWEVCWTDCTPPPSTWAYGWLASRYKAVIMRHVRGRYLPCRLVGRGE